MTGNSLKRHVGVAVPVLGAVALAGAALPVSGALAGDTPDRVDADAGHDAEAAPGAAARHASDPRVQLRELFGLDASPGRIAELMVEGHRDPTSPWLMTPEESAQVEVQLANQQRLALVQGDLRAGLGAAYAGVSIDQTDDGRITVKVAGDVDVGAVVALVRELVPTAGDVDVERVKYGLDELEARAVSVAGELAAVDEVLGAGVNDESSRVEIVIDGLDDESIEDIEAAIGDDPRLMPIEAVDVEPTASWPSYTVWPGQGLGWEQGAHAYDCSMGFGVHSRSGIHSGNYPIQPGPVAKNYALVAGHCAANGQRWRTEYGAGPFLEIGTVVRSTWARSTAHADVAVIELAPNMSVRNETKYLASQIRPLLPPKYSSPPIGAPICKNGRATGVSCGSYAGTHAFATVTHTIQRPGQPPTIVLTRIDRFGAPYPFNNGISGLGDSGALVFQPTMNGEAQTLGVLVGRTHGNPYYTEVVYSSWSSIQEEIGTQFAFGSK